MDVDVNRSSASSLLQDEAGQVSAIGVAQAARATIVLGEKQRGVGALDRILEEQPVHRLQKSLRMFQRDGALAAQIRLEVGHQQSSRDSLARDVADHQSDAVLAQIQKIVIVAAHLASLDANACVIERAERRQRLREEPRLHHPSDLEFLGRTAFAFQLLGNGSALLFERAADVIESHQRERIAVDVYEAREDTAPNWRLIGGRCARVMLDAPEPWRITKAHSAPAPFAEFRDDVFGEENDGCSAADELIIVRVFARGNQAQHRGAVGRGNRNQALARLKPGVQSHVEPEPVAIKFEAAILIPDVDIHGVDAQVRVLPVEANIYASGLRTSMLRHGKCGRDAMRAGLIIVQSYTAYHERKIGSRIALLTAAIGRSQISFLPPTSSPTQGGPVALVTADFNGDGKADLAISETGSHALAIWLGNGDGTFQQSASYPVATTCQLTSLSAGDFTGDHKPDVLGICQFSNQVLVFPSHGDGTFGTAVSTELPEIAFAGTLFLEAIAGTIGGTVGDFNRDGKLDLVVLLISSLPPSISTFPPPTTAFLLPGKGDGTFGTPIPVPRANGAIVMTSGDFNGDGKLDLAFLTVDTGGEDVNGVSIVNQTLFIAMGNGDGTFQGGAINQWNGPTFALSAADVNGDGFVDLYGAGTSFLAIPGEWHHRVQRHRLVGRWEGQFQAGIHGIRPKQQSGE